LFKNRHIFERSHTQYLKIRFFFALKGVDVRN